MRWIIVAALAVGSAAGPTGTAQTAPGSEPPKPRVFERFLSQARPEDRAIAALVALYDVGKASPNDLAELGVLLVNEGFPAWGVDYLQRAVDLDPENVEARFRLGMAFQRQGEERKAIRCYQRLLKKRPGFAYARFLLALAEERNGRRDAAIKDYAKAYHHAPELADPRFNPLVHDSHLQVEAQLALYRRDVGISTFRMTAIDAARIKEMMGVRPDAVMAAQPTAQPPSPDGQNQPGVLPAAAAPAPRVVTVSPSPATAPVPAAPATTGSQRTSSPPPIERTAPTRTEPVLTRELPVQTNPMLPVPNVSGEAQRRP